jgi:hypothetical protein
MVSKVPTPVANSGSESKSEADLPSTYKHFKATPENPTSDGSDDDDNSPVDPDWEDSAVSDDGRVKVTWIDIGEGLSGDYDEEDPDDIPLLRYDTYVHRDKVGNLELEDDGESEWLTLDDGSYCTQVPVDTDSRILKSLARKMANQLSDAIDAGSPKKEAEAKRIEAERLEAERIRIAEEAHLAVLNKEYQDYTDKVKKDTNLAVIAYFASIGIPEDSIQSIHLKAEALSTSYDKGIYKSNFDYDGNFNRLLHPDKEVLEKKTYENRSYDTYFTFVAKIKGFPDYINITGRAERDLSKETKEKDYKIKDKTLKTPDNFYDDINISTIRVILQAKNGDVAYIYGKNNPLKSIVDLVPLLSVAQPKKRESWYITQLDREGNKRMISTQDWWHEFN